jgi:hypothetical protein
MLGIAPSTRAVGVEFQSVGDRDLARLLRLLREQRAGALTVAALRDHGIRAPGQAVYDLQVAGHVIDRVSCVGPDGQRALGYRLRALESELATDQGGYACLEYSHAGTRSVS